LRPLFRGIYPCWLANLSTPLLLSWLAQTMTG
jgi:hypothetical protein